MICACGLKNVGDLHSYGPTASQHELTTRNIITLNNNAQFANDVKRHRSHGRYELTSRFYTLDGEYPLTF